MKKHVVVFGIILSATMVASCAVTTTPYSPDPVKSHPENVVYYPGYNGYTADYGYTTNSENFHGYGGWASSYYTPGYTY